MKRLIALVAAGLASIGVAMAAVNVNTAQQSELQRVKGLDKVKAKEIIDYRAQHGDYRTVEDLGRILDQATVEKVKPELAVSGDPYVPPPKAEKRKKKK